MKQIKELELFHFTWGRPDEGYVWDPHAEPDMDAELPRYIKARGRPPFLLINPKSKKEHRYPPLPFDEPRKESIPLFQHFANLEPTQEKIKEFADTYGWLGIDEPILSAQYHEKLVYGESFQRWRNEINDLRKAVNLWERISGNNEESLKQIVRWVSKEFPRRIIIEREGRKNVLREEYYPDVFRKLKSRDVIGPARVQLLLDMNEKLMGMVSPILLFTRKCELEGHFRPRNLLSALWLQLYQTILGQQQIRKCRYCKEWMDVTDRRADKEAHHKCVNNAKMSRYRSKKRKEQQILSKLSSS